MDPWTHLGSELMEVMSWTTHPIGLASIPYHACARRSLATIGYSLRMHGYVRCTPPAYYVIPSILLSMVWPSPLWTHPGWGKTLRARGALGLGMG